MKFSGNYRANFLDYRSPSIFLITLLKDKNTPAFSKIVATGNIRGGKPEVIAEPTALGTFLNKGLSESETFGQDIKIFNRVIMPDHLHFILRIEKKLPQHLGKYIAAFKRMAFKEAGMQGLLKPTIQSIFTKGFNDQFLSLKRVSIN